jgi:hypothetical protein
VNLCAQPYLIGLLHLNKPGRLKLQLEAMRLGAQRSKNEKGLRHGWSFDRYVREQPTDQKQKSRLAKVSFFASSNIRRV